VCGEQEPPPGSWPIKGSEWRSQRAAPSVCWTSIVGLLIASRPYRPATWFDLCPVSASFPDNRGGACERAVRPAAVSLAGAVLRIRPGPLCEDAAPLRHGRQRAFLDALGRHQNRMSLAKHLPTWRIGVVLLALGSFQHQRSASGASAEPSVLMPS